MMGVQESVGELLYEGKAKKIWSTDDPNTVIQEFKNDVTAFNNLKKDSLEGKGEANSRIATLIFKILEKKGVPSHFIKDLSPTKMLVKRVKIVPVEVIVRNRVAGSFAKRFGLKEGTALPKPLCSMHVKDDALGDPLALDEELVALGFATETQLRTLRAMALQINELLREIFHKAGIEIVDFKLEFGTTHDGKIVLADEISPDTCRLWDAVTGQKLDKDLFRQNLGPLVPRYQEVLKRLEEAL